MSARDFLVKLTLGGDIPPQSAPLQEPPCEPDPDPDPPIIPMRPAPPAAPPEQPNPDNLPRIFDRWQIVVEELDQATGQVTERYTISKYRSKLADYIRSSSSAGKLTVDACFQQLVDDKRIRLWTYQLDETGDAEPASQEVNDWHLANYQAQLERRQQVIRERQQRANRANDVSDDAMGILQNISDQDVAKIVQGILIAQSLDGANAAPTTNSDSQSPATPAPVSPDPAAPASAPPTPPAAPASVTPSEPPATDTSVVPPAAPGTAHVLNLIHNATPPAPAPASFTPPASPPPTPPAPPAAPVTPIQPPPAPAQPPQGTAQNNVLAFLRKQGML